MEMRNQKLDTEDSSRDRSLGQSSAQSEWIARGKPFRPAKPWTDEDADAFLERLKAQKLSEGMTWEEYLQSDDGIDWEVVSREILARPA